MEATIQKPKIAIRAPYRPSPTIYRTTISSNGQIFLPTAIRKELNLQPGDILHIASDNDQITLEKVKTIDQQIDEMAADLDEIRAEWEADLTPEQRKFNQKTAGWTASQYHEYFDKLPQTKAYIKEKFNV